MRDYFHSKMLHLKGEIKNVKSVEPLVESTLFIYFLFHLLSEAFCYENNLSFDIVLIAKPKHI